MNFEYGSSTDVLVSSNTSPIRKLMKINSIKAKRFTFKTLKMFKVIRQLFTTKGLGFENKYQLKYSIKNGDRVSINICEELKTKVSDIYFFILLFLFH